jgi:plastocyanin
MSDKVYRWLIVGISIALAIGLGLTFGKNSSGQKTEQQKQGGTQLVLMPKLTPGATFERRFDQKGVVHFQCAPHPWMKGTIIVK